MLLRGCTGGRNVWDRTFRLGGFYRFVGGRRADGRKAQGARRTAGRGLGAHLAPTLGLRPVRFQCGANCRFAPSGRWVFV